eukprot:32722-Amphidinium_carterae.1
MASLASIADPSKLYACFCAVAFHPCAVSYGTYVVPLLPQIANRSHQTHVGSDCPDCKYWGLAFDKNGENHILEVTLSVLHA